VELDSLHGANIAIGDACLVALDALIGGCDPPQPASIATATQLVSPRRPKPEIVIPYLPKPNEWVSVASVRRGLLPGAIVGDRATQTLL
jgi:hypothetical protein